MGARNTGKAISLSEYKKNRALKARRANSLDLSKMANMTGSQILKEIVGMRNAKELVRELTPQDYYWLIKKIGEDDCLPILEMGKPEQWHHVMDLEIWQRDRIDLPQATLWIKRLELANVNELAKWLYTEGEHFAHYYFFHMLEVRIIEHDDPVNLPEGFFTLDGVFYVRSKEPGMEETIHRILESLASLDLQRYHALLVSLSAVLPAELEEEMFRLRNGRIAEYGFLPFDEAMAVYSALPVKALEGLDEESATRIVTIDDEEVRELIPVAPFSHAQDTSMLAIVAAESRDQEFVERLRLEFAGLCNQILSAEGLRIESFDVLVNTCRRAAGYVNVALEKLSGADIKAAEGIVRKNPLVNLFRVGFGMALRVKWAAERWVKESWFSDLGLPFSFWGEKWGGVLLGLVQKKPLYYTGGKESDMYRDFESPKEVEEAQTVVLRCKVLDVILGHLAKSLNLGRIENKEELTFDQMLFTFWAHDVLDQGRSFEALDITEARALFKELRSSDVRMPYRMKGYKERFVNLFFQKDLPLSKEERELLVETLSLLWDEFREEYQWIKTEDLDPRFSKFVRIKPSL